MCTEWDSIHERPGCQINPFRLTTGARHPNGILPAVGGTPMPAMIPDPLALPHHSQSARRFLLGPSSARPILQGHTKTRSIVTIVGIAPVSRLTTYATITRRT